jgi:hypothetical protein
MMFRKAAIAKSVEILPYAAAAKIVASRGVSR